MSALQSIENYRTRYSVVPSLAQPLRLENSRRPSTRKRLSGGLDKLNRTARRISSELTKLLRPKSQAPLAHEVDKENIPPPHCSASRDFELRPPLCSLPDCDHMFCLPAIPRDYDLNIGHGPEEDHSSIDYSFVTREFETRSEQHAMPYEVIEPAEPELDHEAFLGFSGAWPQNPPQNGSPPSQVQAEEVEEADDSQWGLHQEIGDGDLDDSTGSQVFVSGCEADPEPTQWLHLELEEWDAAEWSEVFYQMFDETSSGSSRGAAPEQDSEEYV